MPKFRGLKITQDRNVQAKFPDVHRVRCKPGVNELLLEQPGEIGWGGNGGFHALNITLQAGSRAIILVGFDMNLQRGVHWHGRHPPGMSNPRQASVDKWRAHLDAQAFILHRIGAEVVIGSPGSALTAYRKLTLKEAINGLVYPRALSGAPSEPRPADHPATVGR